MRAHRFLLALAVLACVPGAALAARSYDNCTGFIDSLPATITTQGTWCLRKDLATGMTGGTAIHVATNNVIVDCNDFKVGNLSAGTTTLAAGIAALNRVNVVVRNCNVRGFNRGISLSRDSAEIVSSYTVESNTIQGATTFGILVAGSGVVRGNAVSDIGDGHTTDMPAGIWAQGQVHILDNAVTGVVGSAGASGIYTEANAGGSVSGNRVRGVDHGWAGEAVGIRVAYSVPMSIRDNYLYSSDSDHIGLECWHPGARARARGNVITGFVTGMSNCGDAGGNDVTF